MSKEGFHSGHEDPLWVASSASVLSEPVADVSEAPSKDLRVACTGTHMTRESNGPQTWIGSDDLLAFITKIRYALERLHDNHVDNDDWRACLTKYTFPISQHSPLGLSTSYDYDNYILCRNVYFETWRLTTPALRTRRL
jgi:hypothetical protein